MFISLCVHVCMWCVCICICVCMCDVFAVYIYAYVYVIVCDMCVMWLYVFVVYVCVHVCGAGVDITIRHWAFSEQFHVVLSTPQTICLKNIFYQYGVYISGIVCNKYSLTIHITRNLNLEIYMYENVITSNPYYGLVSASCEVWTLIITYEYC